MNPGGQISIWIALTAGVGSFFTPCVLPLIPTYMGYLTGVSASQLTEDPAGLRRTVLINSLAFITGFSLVFIAFGLSASAVGKLLLQHQVLLGKISGLVIIFFGLHLVGIFKITLLQREKRAGFTPGRAGPVNSFLLGTAFSLGWTPCIGPILGSILLMASNSGEMLVGGYLLAAYSLGLGLPFLLAGIFSGWLVKGLQRWSRLLPRVNQAGGILLIILGIMIFTGTLSVIQ